MSVTFCTTCQHTIDPQEDDYYTHPESLKSYCEDCYDKSPLGCERDFDTTGDCICGEHRILQAEEDIGINHSYLELRA